MIEDHESTTPALTAAVTTSPPGTADGPTAHPGAGGDYRDRLRSRRWDAAPLANPEVELTDPRIAVAFIAGLCALSFIVIVAGYATGFWG